MSTKIGLLKTLTIIFCVLTQVACSADLERDMSVMAGSEVTLEHRILFR